MSEQNEQPRGLNLNLDPQIWDVGRVVLDVVRQVIAKGELNKISFPVTLHGVKLNITVEKLS